MVKTCVRKAGNRGGSSSGIAVHIRTGARSPRLPFAILLRMTMPMTTLATKRAEVVIRTAIHYMGVILGTKARVITATDSAPTAWLGPGFEAGLWSTPICAIGGSSGLESVREIFSDLLYGRQILPR